MGLSLRHSAGAVHTNLIYSVSIDDHAKRDTTIDSALVTTEIDYGAHGIRCSTLSSITLSDIKNDAMIT